MWPYLVRDQCYLNIIYIIGHYYVISKFVSHKLLQTLSPGLCCSMMSLSEWFLAPVLEVWHMQWEWGTSQTSHMVVMLHNLCNMKHWCRPLLQSKKKWQGVQSCWICLKMCQGILQWYKWPLLQDICSTHDAPHMVNGPDPDTHYTMTGSPSNTKQTGGYLFITPWKQLFYPY